MNIFYRGGRMDKKIVSELSSIKYYKLDVYKLESYYKLTAVVITFVMIVKQQTVMPFLHVRISQ